MIRLGTLFLAFGVALCALVAALDHLGGPAATSALVGGAPDAALGAVYLVARITAFAAAPPAILTGLACVARGVATGQVSASSSSSARS